ncbi:putative exopolysaccharide synthesis protein [Sulfitobacter noctilucicola]|uniref:Exopolysaccharide synthesis, ExoD n=1 Tax=Sulfitobacter noctilucicola TaxID=1342301 RepID=A0A7W6M5J4_9RHOB|nr:exopolysaccharide biosynthesis protein [Sulfitobacter noctilucicola]KIN62632.1 putative exopolysaccharide synthesis protein [Sulfitobacter noctilucicola]MBB4172834.1 hypothetical protein [Sulfitobacter noctilucicola]
MQSTSTDQTLNYLLDGVDHAAQKDRVKISDILSEFGNRAITPFILLVALLLVSPISGIPGTPTVAAIIIVLLSAQALFGQDKPWLPAWLMRLEIDSDRVRKATSWMRRPCDFLDRHHRERLTFLTVGPMRWVTLLTCVIIPLGWPFLEVLPFVSSLGAGTVSLFAFGLFTRDGIYVLGGYVVVCITVVTTVLVLT